MKTFSIAFIALTGVACSHDKTPANDASVASRTSTTTTTTSADGTTAAYPSSQTDEYARNGAPVGDSSMRDPSSTPSTNTDATVKSRTETTGTGTTGSASNASSSNASSQALRDTPRDTPPDNTRVNQRDRNDAELTPMDQSNTESDTKITQLVRKAVVADKSLSFTAKNVKIITQGGKVTLRGPVNTQAERASIEQAAKNVAGVASVDNQLEVKP